MERQQHLANMPLDRDAVTYAVQSIPADRGDEMLREFADAAAKKDPSAARKTLVRWIMIGSHYADPNRAENHPLNAVIGTFKHEPRWDRLMERIAGGRRENSTPKE